MAIYIRHFRSRIAAPKILERIECFSKDFKSIFFKFKNNENLNKNELLPYIA